MVSFCLPTEGSSTSRTEEDEQLQGHQVPRPDTPTRRRITDNSEFECFYVKPQREALVEYLGGKICWSTVEFFFSNILPPVSPQFNIESIYGLCIKEKILKNHDDDDDDDDGCGPKIWSAFIETPKNNDDHETSVFKPLEKIFNSITKLAKKKRTNGSYCPALTTYFCVGGSTATWSEKSSDLKPDAHVYLIEPRLGYPEGTCGRHWYNSVFVLEFKKHNNQESEVMSHLFFAITIPNHLFFAEL